MLQPSMSTSQRGPCRRLRRLDMQHALRADGGRRGSGPGLLRDPLQVLVVGHLPVDEPAVVGKVEDAVGTRSGPADGRGWTPSTLHFTASRPLFTAAMDSRSRWLVGWSSSSTLAPESIIRESMHRTFSPPESTFTGLYTSSPEKSIRPRKPRR